LELFHPIEFVTLKFLFQIAEEKEVTRTDIRAGGRLGSMSELAKLKAISVAADR
jgi:hypothetical protein